MPHLSAEGFPEQKLALSENSQETSFEPKVYTRRLDWKIRSILGEFAGDIGTQDHCQSRELIELDGADIPGR